MIISYKINYKNLKKRSCNKNIFVIQEDAMQKNNKKEKQKMAERLDTVTHSAPVRCLTYSR